MRIRLRDEHRLIVAIAVGIFVSWAGNASMHAFIFNEHSFVEELFFVGSVSENFLHVLVILEFIIFGVIFYRIFIRRNLLEKTLRESKQRWATTLNSVGDGVIATDVEGKITFLNREAEKLTGWTLKEASQRSFNEVFKIVNEQTRLEAEDPVAKVLKSGLIVSLANHTALLRKDGSEVPIDDSAAPIKDQTGNITGAVLVFRDRSERKKAEEALAESEAKYRALVENAQDAILLTDLKGTTLYKNHAYLKNLGFEENEEAQAYKVTKIHPEDLASVRQKGQDLFKTGSSTLEYRIKHRSGLWIYRHATSTILRNMKNEPYAILSIIRDTTERKLQEMRLKESNQRIELMNEKLRVVGGLTRHDVRNKLSAVTGYAYLLKKKHADEADIVEGLGKMEQAVKESVRIFEFAKMYEHLGSEELTYLNVEAKLNEATTLFSGSLSKIINECQGLTVLADSFLRQLFYNFIDNTRKYGKKTTTIRVHYEKAYQDSLRLVYEDDGVGISAANKLKLFKEGFSTGGSTGFGLFLTKKMVDIYGWEIEENGDPGIGAKFTITIPKRNKNGKENFQIT